MNDCNKCTKCANSTIKPLLVRDLALIGSATFLLFPIVFYLAQRSSPAELLKYITTVWTMCICVAIGRGLVAYYNEYKKTARKG